MAKPPLPPLHPVPCSSPRGVPHRPSHACSLTSLAFSAWGWLSSLTWVWQPTCLLSLGFSSGGSWYSPGSWGAGCWVGANRELSRVRGGEGGGRFAGVIVLDGQVISPERSSQGGQKLLLVVAFQPCWTMQMSPLVTMNIHQERSLLNLGNSSRLANEPGRQRERERSFFTLPFLSPASFRPSCPGEYGRGRAREQGPGLYVPSPVLGGLV